eukprot:jgi/Chlat1/2899/Chrsp2S04654
MGGQHAFVGLRPFPNFSSTWQMPQGGIDEGEDPLEAAVRELQEETGVVSAELIASHPGWLAYTFPDDVQHQLTDWKGKYIGQTQKWFLFRFTGDESEMNLEGGEEIEFVQWRWAPFDSVLSSVVDFKKEVYREVLAHFTSVLAEMPALHK